VKADPEARCDALRTALAAMVRAFSPGVVVVREEALSVDSYDLDAAYQLAVETLAAIPAGEGEP
jgi:hypothetical protein